MCDRAGYSYGVSMLIGQQTLFRYAQDECNVSCIVTGEKWKQNTYIVTHRSSFNTIIIDPGDSADLLIQHIQNDGGKVSRILLTHPHHDHVGAAAQASEYFDVTCELHKQDVRLLMHAPMYALSFASKKISPVSRFQPFDELCLPSEEPALLSIHTPGHTKGSVCYLFDDFAMTGDTLLHSHVGRTDLPGSCAEEISGSVRELLNQLRDDVLMFPGHGKPWTVGQAKAWWREAEMTPPIYNNFSQL